MIRKCNECLLVRIRSIIRSRVALSSQSQRNPAILSALPDGPHDSCSPRCTWEPSGSQPASHSACVDASTRYSHPSTEPSTAWIGTRCSWTPKPATGIFFGKGTMPTDQTYTKLRRLARLRQCLRLDRESPRIGKTTHWFPSFSSSLRCSAQVLLLRIARPFRTGEPWIIHGYLSRALPPPFGSM